MSAGDYFFSPDFECDISCISLAPELHYTVFSFSYYVTFLWGERINVFCDVPLEKCPLGVFKCCKSFGQIFKAQKFGRK